MKLTYRGISYETNSAPATVIPVPSTDMKYRGASYRRNQAVKTEALNAVMTYRGAQYNTQPVPVKPVVAATPEPSIAEKARLLTANHYRTAKKRQQSLLNRAATAVGFTGDVRNYWNHIQGDLHPRFRLDYDRSHSALS